ncbi:MAG: hypothetical protein KIT73_21010, partial [Burkholderiales bacterium]|nr:hypothetical protein [Burkholderiales bacterium]
MSPAVRVPIAESSRGTRALRPTAVPVSTRSTSHRAIVPPPRPTPSAGPMQPDHTMSHAVPREISASALAPFRDVCAHVGVMVMAATLPLLVSLPRFEPARPDPGAVGNAVPWSGDALWMSLAFVSLGLVVLSGAMLIRDARRRLARMAEESRCVPAAPTVSDRAPASIPDEGEGLQLHGRLAFERLQRIAELLATSAPSELTLRKSLHLLADTLGVDSAGLRLSPDSRAALRCQALLCTGEVPPTLLDEGAWAIGAGVSQRVDRMPDGRGVRCLVVSLRREAQPIAVLAVTAPGPGVFAELDVRLAQTAALLIALALSSVSRGQEERRGALLEERAAIARELHDSLAQSLAFLKIQVARLQLVLREGNSTDTATQTAAQVR